MNQPSLIPKKFSIGLLGLSIVLVALLFGLGKINVFHQGIKTNPANALAQEWYQHALQAERFTNGYRVPIAARMYAYVGLAAYEAAVPHLGGSYQSLAPRFANLCLPPLDSHEEYYLPAVLNGCYSSILEKFFVTAGDEIKLEHKLLEQKWDILCQKETEATIFSKSKEFGEQVALAVFNWSATDSLGHQAYLHLFDRNYVPPGGDGKWTPCPDFPLPALLPYWGNVRPFLEDPAEYLARPYPQFSTSSNSVFYTQALEIYTLSKPLSHENQWIAEFWSDDQPGLTFSPSGRWVSITNQVITMENPDVGKTLETYLKIGLALHDAAVACWKSKYHYNLLRPESYITQVFDHNWHPLHHTPPFPAYPSGHAMFGAAAAEILTNIYGQGFEMVDKSHDGRKEFKGMPRSFHSFYEMAFENAFSRIPLGVHFRMDCEEGTRLGLLLGKNIGALKLKLDGDITMK